VFGEQMGAARSAAERHQQPARHSRPDAGRRAVAKKFGGFHRREQRLLSASRDRRRDLAALIDVRAPTRHGRWSFATCRGRRSEGCRGAAGAREHRDLARVADALVRWPGLALLGYHRGRARRNEGRRGAGDAAKFRDLASVVHASVRGLALLGGDRAHCWLVCQILVLITSATHRGPVVHRRSSVAIERGARHGVNDGGR
jgi:hypothetical protein